MSDRFRSRGKTPEQASPSKDGTLLGGAGLLTTMNKLDTDKERTSERKRMGKFIDGVADNLDTKFPQVGACIRGSKWIWVCVLQIITWLIVPLYKALFFLLWNTYKILAENGIKMVFGGGLCCVGGTYWAVLSAVEAARKAEEEAAASAAARRGGGHVTNRRASLPSPQPARD